MSLITTLAKQRLISERNNAIYNSLQNNSAQRQLLSNPNQDVSFNGRVAAGLEAQQVLNEVNLAAINAELNSLNDSKLNYLA